MDTVCSAYLASTFRLRTWADNGPSRDSICIRSFLCAGVMCVCLLCCDLETIDSKIEGFLDSLTSDSVSTSYRMGKFGLKTYDVVGEGCADDYL